MLTYRFYLVAAMCLCLSISVLGQDHRTRVPARMAVTLSPQTVLSFQPRLRAGVLLEGERVHYLMDLEYGGRWMPHIVEREPGSNYRYLGVRPEIRYLLNPVGREAGFLQQYLGGALAVNHYFRDLGARNYRRSDGQRFEFDSARRSRLRVSLQVLYTLRYAEAGPFFFEAYGGLGLVYRSIDYRNRVGDRPFVENPLGLFDLEFNEGRGTKEGVRVVPEIPLGLRIGYRFG